MHRFEPDYVSPPGATLQEVLDELGMSQSDLAIRAGMAHKTINQIVNGVAPISVETADKLELVTGTPASFWNRRELAYREVLNRIEATQKLEADVAWLKEIPATELVKRRFVQPTDDKPLLVRRALQFFGVSSVESWKKLVNNPALQFRGKASQDKRPGYVAAWRRMGVLQGHEVTTQPFDSEAFRQALLEVREMTVLPAAEWPTKVRNICAGAGVAVVLTREIPGAGVSGIARWLAKDKALIQLSLKYKTDDQVWFTFFHEAGHIVLHRKKLVFMDFGYSEETKDEREANSFARDLLIPRAYASRLPFLKSARQIKEFAAELKIAPGIVVGRLQHDGFIGHRLHHGLKRKYEWGQL